MSCPPFIFWMAWDGIIISTKNNWRLTFDWVIFIVVSLFFIYSFNRIQTRDSECGRNDLIDSVKSNGRDFLVSLKSVQTTIADRTARLQYLTQTALQTQQINLSGLQSTERIKGDARNFYIIILAALLTIVLSGRYHANFWGHLVAMCMVITMYGLDVHMDNLTKRVAMHLECDGNTVRHLLRIQPQDSTSWFVLKYDKCIPEIDRASNPDTQRNWKIHFALSPNLEQFVFYILPLLVFSIPRKYGE